MSSDPPRQRTGNLRRTKLERRYHDRRDDDERRQPPEHGERARRAHEVFQNLDEPIKEVCHADLELFAPEHSKYRAKCPAENCNQGILMVSRDQTTFDLLKHDRCIACGQQFIYSDEEINGEKLV